MAVAGVPEPSPHHAIEMADFALSMLEAIRRVKARLNLTNLEMRVGMHSGPVTAGVLRTNKRRFQLFGAHSDCFALLNVAIAAFQV